MLLLLDILIILDKYSCIALENIQGVLLFEILNLIDLFRGFSGPSQLYHMYFHVIYKVSVMLILV